MFDLRSQTPQDDDAIDAVVTAAFGRTNEAVLVRRLRAEAGYDPRLSIVARIDGRTVGHVLLTPISIEQAGATTPALALAPVAVTPEFQRRGIGSQLVRAGLDAARAAGHGIVIVLGHAAYYPRFGFRPASDFGITAPFDVPAEAFMALELRAGALDGVHGVVRYPAAFMECG